MVVLGKKRGPPGPAPSDRARWPWRPRTARMGQPRRSRSSRAARFRTLSKGGGGRRVRGAHPPAWVRRTEGWRRPRVLARGRGAARRAGRPAPHRPRQRRRAATIQLSYQGCRPGSAARQRLSIATNAVRQRGDVDRKAPGRQAVPAPAGCQPYGGVPAAPPAPPSGTRGRCRTRRNEMIRTSAESDTLDSRDHHGRDRGRPGPSASKNGVWLTLGDLGQRPAAEDHVARASSRSAGWPRPAGSSRTRRKRSARRRGRSWILSSRTRRSGPCPPGRRRRRR